MLFRSNASRVCCEERTESDSDLGAALYMDTFSNCWYVRADTCGRVYARACKAASDYKCYGEQRTPNRASEMWAGHAPGLPKAPNWISLCEAGTSALRRFSRKTKTTEYTTG